MPVLLRRPVGVWTGDEVLVVARDRSNQTSQAAAYNPATDHWRVLPEIPIDNVPPLTSAPGYVNELAWIDGFAVATIGFVNSRTPLPLEPAHRLVVWDAKENRWFTPDEFVLPRGQGFQIAATRDEILVFTGASSSDYAAYRYRPATGEVLPFRRPPSDGPILAHPIWTGKYVVFTYGNSPTRLDPVTETFVPLGTLADRADRRSRVWTGTEVILWGGQVPAPVGTVTTNHGIAFPPRPVPGQSAGG
jgi:hypothetical protein